MVFCIDDKDATISRILRIVKGKKKSMKESCKILFFPCFKVLYPFLSLISIVAALRRAQIAGQEVVGIGETIHFYAKNEIQITKQDQAFPFVHPIAIVNSVLCYMI